MKLSETHRIIIAIAVVIIGICIGIYIGFVWALIGGIAQVVEQLRSEQISTHMLAWGVVKILCSGFICWIIILISALIAKFIKESE